MKFSSVSPSKKPRSRFLSFPCGLLLAGLTLLAGCATPEVSTEGNLTPDQKDSLGGSFIESEDIRTVATRVTASLLSLPQLAAQPGSVLVAIAPMKNSTRYVIDKDIFMARLRIELNRVSQGRIGFLAQDLGQTTRSEILAAQDEEAWERLLDQCADSVAIFLRAKETPAPVNLAVIPVKNCNLAGVNADSFTTLLRSRVLEKAPGRAQFLAREESGKIISQVLAENDLRNAGLVLSNQPGVAAGVDYFLGGEFTAESLTSQATTLPAAEAPGQDPTRASGTPNVNKHLTVMLIDARSGAVTVEKRVLLERKMDSGLAKAKYLLTGELRALSKASEGGDRSDYVIMSFQLVDPQTNNILWEDAYETKKQTKSSVLYK